MSLECVLFYVLNLSDLSAFLTIVLKYHGLLSSSSVVFKHFNTIIYFLWCYQKLLPLYHKLFVLLSPCKFWGSTVVSIFKSNYSFFDGFRRLFIRYLKIYVHLESIIGFHTWITPWVNFYKRTLFGSFSSSPIGTSMWVWFLKTIVSVNVKIVLRNEWNLIQIVLVRNVVKTYTFNNRKFNESMIFHVSLDQYVGTHIQHKFFCIAWSLYLLLERVRNSLHISNCKSVSYFLEDILIISLESCYDYLAFLCLNTIFLVNIWPCLYCTVSRCCSLGK